MVTSTSIKKADPYSIDTCLVEGSQEPALNASKGQCSMTNEDCINSSCSSISSEDITLNPLTHSTASRETSSPISFENSYIHGESTLKSTLEMDDKFCFFSPWHFTILDYPMPSKEPSSSASTGDSSINDEPILRKEYKEKDDLT